jgi:hypothetical protein
MKKSPLKLSNAILWFLLIAAPLPFLVFLFNFIFGIQKLQQLEEKVEKLHAKTALAQKPRPSLLGQECRIADISFA